MDMDDELNFLFDDINKTNKEIIALNKAILNNVEELTFKEYRKDVEECLNLLNEESISYGFGLMEKLSLVKANEVERLEKQDEDLFELIPYVKVDQYCNGGYTGDEFSGWYYIPITKDLYLKTHYNM